MIYVQIDFHSSHQERESGRGGSNQGWQIESLAICVPKTMQVVVAFQTTGRRTVEATSSIVHSATNHLGELIISRLTFSFTLGRNHTSANSATIQPIKLTI